MKAIKNILKLICLLVLVSCNDSFLERFPETKITKENFFSNVEDLKTYTNGFYSHIGTSYNDLYSDNISHYNSSNTEIERIMRGEIDESNVGGWSWSTLRQINFMLDNLENVTGPEADIKHYIGIARFFRAKFYYGMVKRYSDVPWYSHVLATTDEDLLYKGCDSRSLVVDSVMADLNYAIANISETGDPTLVTKWAALHLKARIALHEGTFRKYHSDLELNDYDDFLTEAVNASSQIMNGGSYELHSDYTALFKSKDLQGNKEMIMFADYDLDMGRGHNGYTVFDYEYSLSKDLVDSYLRQSDGSPVSTVAGYETMTIHEIFDDRDPRMLQTVMQPGYMHLADTKPYRLKPYLGGYNQIKFVPNSEDTHGWYKSITDLPIFRLGEVLLINAEAKAELGSISQSDLDNTVNLLRDRVGMPHMVLGVVNSNIDSRLEQEYSNVSGSNKGVILEIRRERRVELACEGFRYDDLMRWRLGKDLENAPKGMYFPQLGAMDVTGDGIEDIAILETAEATGPLDGLDPDVRDALSIYPLKDKNGNDNSFYLEHGTYGNIMFTSDREHPKQFIEPKYYYRPIPEAQILLNPKLKSPEGW